MPLRKRILYDPAAYHRKDVFEESTLDTYLQDHNMSKMLGAMNQIAYLSTFALEVMQNLSILTEDLSERIKVASVRTKNLYGNLKSVDRQVASIDDESHVAAIPGMSKYLQSREMFTPQLFNKSTNYSSVSLQYRICRSPPQLWRIEVFTDEDCFRNYSNPGFFFQEWIRSEIIRQRRGKEEKKRNKALKKAQRQERKKLKEAAAEEELFNTIYSSADVSANASANVSLSGLTGERRNKSMLRYNRANEDRFDEPIAQSQGQTRQQQQLQGWQYEHQNTADDVEDSPWPDQRAQQQDHSGWMYETDEQAPPGSGAEGVEAEEEEDYENEDANIDRAASAAAAAASASTKSKGKSKLKGLTKLFKKKKSKKAGAVEDSTDEETSPTNAGTGGAAAGPRPSFSKMDSRSMHMLDVPATDRERGRNPRQQEEEGHDGDSGNEDQLQNQRSPRLPKSTVPNHTPKPPPRPMSYADELAARAVNTRRQSLLHNTNTMDLHLHTASDPSAAEHTHPYGIDNNNNITEMEDVEPNLVMSIKVPKKQQKAPVTMKIGNKFLSASTLGKVGATTPLLTSSSATSALESSSMTATGVSGVSGRLADAQRRGSRVNMVHSSAVLSTEAAGELGGAGAGANWETQRLASKGNLLLKPPPPTAGIILFIDVSCFYDE